MSPSYLRAQYLTNIWAALRKVNRHDLEVIKSPPVLRDNGFYYRYLAIQNEFLYVQHE